MSSLFRFGRPLAFVAVVVVLAACQGSVGQTPPVVPNSIQAPVVQSAQQAGTEANGEITAHAEVTYAPDLTSLEFPSTDGYALSVALSAASPAAAMPSPRASTLAHVESNAIALPVPSGSPIPAAHARGRHADRANDEKNANLIELGMTAHPAGAPAAPSPGASAIPMRSAVLRAALHSPYELAIGSLDALHFTVPESAGHDFSVAVFEERRHKKQALIASDTAVKLDAKGVAATSGNADAVTFKAGRAYSVYLYADATAAPIAPAPVFSPGGGNVFAPVSGANGSPAPISNFPRMGGGAR